MSQKIKVILVKSIIKCNKNQRRILQALGIHRIYEEKYVNNIPAIQGMLSKVQHLVKLELV